MRLYYTPTAKFVMDDNTSKCQKIFIAFRTFLLVDAFIIN